MMLFDPILRAPVVACVSMGISLALFGVCLLYEKRSLVGEALSHAAYPGVVGGVLLSMFFSFELESIVTFFAFFGALCTCLLGVLMLKWLPSKQRVSQDGALSFVLSSSFAVALLFISLLQAQYGAFGRLMQSLLIGQVATVSDMYSMICVVFSLLVVVSFCFLFRSLQANLFDKEFMSVHGVHIAAVELGLLVLLSCAVMLGIRTMGVVLLTSAFIFPAICSRYLAKSLKGQFCVAAILGGSVNLLGVLLSHSVSLGVSDGDGRSLWLPTGPLIALLFMALFLFLFLFAPTDGFVFRTVRSWNFRFRCQCENSLKSLWKVCSQAKTSELDRFLAYEHVPSGAWMRSCVVHSLISDGYICKERNKLILTPLGLLRGQKLVRLHRLWELYLVQYCGMSHERVHPQAEEMEHVLTPEVERELSALLKNPIYCPHRAPIPPSSDEILLREGEPL